METGIGEVVKDGKGNAIIYTALLAAVIANVMPSPADYLYFNSEYENKKKLENNEITPSQYWTRDILAYYGYTAGYYALLFLILYATKGTYKNNAKILIALLSGGLIIGIYNKNVLRDEELQDLHKQQQDALAKKLGVTTCDLSLPVVCLSNSCIENNQQNS